MGKLNYSQKIERLTELLNDEHGCCDLHTCDIGRCMSHGYYLWAIQLFAWCGAASDEFKEVFVTLPKVFTKDAEDERIEFVETVSHAQCPHCNAVVWDLEWVSNKGLIFCDSCAEDFPPTQGGAR